MDGCFRAAMAPHGAVVGPGASGESPETLYVDGFDRRRGQPDKDQIQGHLRLKGNGRTGTFRPWGIRSIMGGMSGICQEKNLAGFGREEGEGLVRTPRGRRSGPASGRVAGYICGGGGVLSGALRTQSIMSFARMPRAAPPPMVHRAVRHRSISRRSTYPMRSMGKEMVSEGT